MKTKIFILIALLANTVCSLAQESAQSDGTEKYAQPVEHPSVYSPQVEAMMRYDNSSVNLNTGTVSLTVPLVEFDDPDFDLDVSITYSSDGFKPLQPDNFVGMGWRLNCGGVITREVHGIPDEFNNIHTDGGFVGCYEIPNLKGFRMGTPADASFMDKVVNPGNLDGQFRQAYIEEGTRKIVVRNNGKSLQHRSDHVPVLTADTHNGLHVFTGFQFVHQRAHFNGFRSGAEYQHDSFHGFLPDSILSADEEAGAAGVSGCFGSHSRTGKVPKKQRISIIGPKCRRYSLSMAALV